jgi:hypothetical protein
LSVSSFRAVDQLRNDEVLRRGKRFLDIVEVSKARSELAFVPARHTVRMVPRCLVWVIAKLTHVWDIQIELTGSVIGGGSEVDEVSKPARHSFG